MEKQKVSFKNIDSVSFGKCEIITYLSTRYDSEQEISDTVKLTFKLTDSDETKWLAMDRLAAALRVKVNSVGGVLKGAVPTAKTYREMLKKNNFEFEFSIDELLTPAERKEADVMRTAVRAQKHMTDEQLMESIRMAEALIAQRKGA